MDAPELARSVRSVTMFTRLDAIHTTVRGSKLLRRFTWAVRILLALGFIPPGLWKVLGIPFTKIPDSNPVGLFFDGLEQAGLLYQFIGTAQVVAAVLLLIPRTAALGALVYLPIISGIEVLTTTVPFPGTWVITSLMLLGVIYLLCWDWNRVKYVVYPQR